MVNVSWKQNWTQGFKILTKLTFGFFDFLLGRPGLLPFHGINFSHRINIFLKRGITFYTPPCRLPGMKWLSTDNNLIKTKCWQTQTTPSIQKTYFLHFHPFIFFALQTTTAPWAVFGNLFNAPNLKISPPHNMHQLIHVQWGSSHVTKHLQQQHLSNTEFEMFKLNPPPTFHSLHFLSPQNIVFPPSNKIDSV